MTRSSPIRIPHRPQPQFKRDPLLEAGNRFAWRMVWVLFCVILALLVVIDKLPHH